MGAMFFFAFGGAWLAFWAFSDFTPAWPWLSAVAALTVLFFLRALQVYRFNKPALLALEGNPEAKRKSRWFNIVNVGQWVAIFLMANVLQRQRLSAYILPTVIAIVGVHFIALAPVFKNRSHYVTGAALIIWPFVFSFANGPSSSVGALGAGLVLWGSASWALRPSGTTEHAA